MAGNIFDMFSDPLSGAIGANGQIDPQAVSQARAQQGLLGLAAGLLSQGASRLPVTFGSSLGRGLLGMMQGEQGVENALRSRAATAQAAAQTGLLHAQLPFLAAKTGMLRSASQQESGLMKLLFPNGANTGATSGAVPGATSGAPGAPQAAANPATAPLATVALLHSAAAQDAARNGVDPQFYTAQIQAESAFQPDARNPQPVNGQYATGIAQFMPSTAAQYGVDPLNPDQALAGGARYMADLLRQNGGDYVKAAQAYGTLPKDLNSKLTQGQQGVYMAALDANARQMQRPGTAAPAATPSPAPAAGTASAMPPAPGGAMPDYGRITTALGAMDAPYTMLGMGSPYAGVISAIEKFHGPETNPALQAQIARAKAYGTLPADIAKERASFVPLYRNGVVYDPLANGAHGAIVSAAPTMTKIVDPQTGEQTLHYASPLTGLGPSLGTTELGPGLSERLKTQANELQKERASTLDEGESAQMAQVTLKRLLADTQSFTSGPFAEMKQQAQSYLRLIDPSFTEPVASYEDFMKNAGALVRKAVRQESSRAAVQEYRMIQDTLPNPEMSPQGLQMVTRELMGLNDYRVAKVQAMQQWERSHGYDLTDFDANWQKRVTPYTFVFARMMPDERAKIVAKLRGSDDGKQQLQTLTQQLQYLKLTGFGSVMAQ